MKSVIQKVLALLAISERKKLYGLVIAIIIMSMFDMLGIASIFPFLSVISNPEVIETNSKLKLVYESFGFTSKDTFLITLGGVSLILLILSNVFRALVNISLLRFTWLKRHTISKRLLAQYLYEPYAFFLNRNSSELITYLVSEVARVVSNVLIPCMQLFARCTLALLILALLFAVNPWVATVVVVVIGGGYAIIYVLARNKLAEAGKEIVRYSKIMYKVLNESFGGIKDIKLLGKEDVFIQQYSKPVKEMVHCYSSRFIISQFPRYAFEVMTFGGILLITIYLVVIKNNYQQVIPLVGLYAFAAYRLMPTLQQIFQDLTSIRFGRATLDTIHHDFFNCTDVNHEQHSLPIQALPFLENVEFRDVTFQYPKAQKAVIENFNLNIKANTTIGFVGGTGAGKTTVIDILLGLLQPQKGMVVVDDVKIDKDNLRKWQKNIGYVSQHIYLSDDTIARNVAFGVPDNEIDLNAVIRAAQLANIHNFIENELSDSYETVVGERGVRLSGGQRQRIGIARALYYNPSMLVFDEATSALDGITEETILESIHNLTHKKTIIIIAHRLTTVKECDTIYFLEQGSIIDQGTYTELLTNNQQFRKMTNEYSK